MLPIRFHHPSIRYRLNLIVNLFFVISARAYGIPTRSTCQPMRNYWEETFEQRSCAGEGGEENSGLIALIPQKQIISVDRDSEDYTSKNIMITFCFISFFWRDSQGRQWSTFDAICEPQDLLRYADNKTCGWHCVTEKKAFPSLRCFACSVNQDSYHCCHYCICVYMIMMACRHFHQYG